MLKHLPVSVIAIYILLSVGSAAVMEKEVWVSPFKSDSLEFTVEREGTIYAEVIMQDGVELCAFLVFLGAGDGEEKKVQDCGRRLVLKYDVTARDVESGTRWLLLIESKYGEGGGYVRLEYPERAEIRAPLAYLVISPNPAAEGERVTFSGYGIDADGEVVECRLTFPDGRTISVEGDTLELVLESNDVLPGIYRFAVLDNDGIWSEEVELEFGVNSASWSWEYMVVILGSAAVLTTMAIRWRARKSEAKDSKDSKESESEQQEQLGSIYANSQPEGALVYVNGGFKNRSPVKVEGLSAGAHVVTFRKFGYLECRKEAFVKAGKVTTVHCDLTKIPGLKLKIWAEPDEIQIGQKSTITVRLEDRDGRPVPVPEDVFVTLETTVGDVESPIRIPAGRTSAKARLTSKVTGTATVRAEVGMLNGSTETRFLRVN